MPRWIRRPPAPLILLGMAAIGLLAGCGSDTTAVELASVGRTIEAELPMTDTEPVVAGLPSCVDAPLLVPEPDATPSGAISIDQRVMAVLADYTAANEATFAGLWLDARYGGAPVVAFSDEPAPHRRAILDALAGDGRTMAFGLVQAGHSESELRAGIGELTAAFAGERATVLQDVAIDAIRNRLSLELLDPTDDELDRVLALLPQDMVCAEIVTSAPIPDGPLDVLPRDGVENLLSCGELPFPESALLDPAPIGSVDHPAAALVAEFTGDSPGAADRAGAAGIGDWIVLDLGPDRALFGKYDGGVEATATAVRSGSGWEIFGWAFGCELRVGLPYGLGAVEIFLDPASPPGPGSRVVNVLVSELACADGEAMGDRLLGPQVLELDGRILLAFAAAVRPGDAGNCPGNPMTSVRVELDRPIGARSILNGMQLPPRPLTTP